MLLFNSVKEQFRLGHGHISKHLMLLFNEGKYKGGKAKKIFQNISCYCLTKYQSLKEQEEAYFKTSHVIV